MSIDGINGGITSPLFAPGLRPNGTEEPRESGRQVAPTGQEQPAPTRRMADAVPVEAPEGTDPPLWSVLTSEERSFFARARAMGPVTYGPGRLTALSGAPLGGRFDLRV